MTYSQLKYFLEVAHLKNFTYAAERLYVTTPSLSKCISSLEDELGFKLFERKNRGVELTENGKIFYNAIETPYYQLELAFNHTIERINSKRQIITIAANEGELLHPSLTKLINQYNRQYAEKYQFIIRLESVNEIYAGLSNNIYDLAILTETQLKNMANVSYYKLNESALSFALPANHPLADKEILSFDDLDGERFIVIKPDDKSDFIEPLMKLLCHAHDAMFVYSLQEALYNVACGNGVAILPHNSIDVDNPFIKRIPLPARINKAHYCIAWLSENKSPIVKELSQAIYNDFLFVESKKKPTEFDEKHNLEPVPEQVPKY